MTISPEAALREKGFAIHRYKRIAITPAVPRMNQGFVNLGRFRAGF